jgi:hypothetical protein
VIGRALAIVGLLVVIVLFNAFPNRVGVLITATDSSSFISALAPGFRAYLSWLNLWSALGVALNGAWLAFHLGYLHETWQQTLRWADWGLSLVGMVILYSLIVGDSVFQPGFEWVNRVLAVALVAAIVGSGSRLVRRLRTRPADGR